MSRKPATTATDQDAPWKEILERYFPDFMAFFFPQIHRDLDWQRGYESLDKELEKLSSQSQSGRRFVDKLMKVYRLGATEPSWVLIHVEVQGYADPDFAQRMFIYHYRLFDRFYPRQTRTAKGRNRGSASGKAAHPQEKFDRVVSLAIITEPGESYRPDLYEQKEWGFELTFKFPSIKLLDYNKDWVGLEANSNPFAVVVMAVLKSQQEKEASQRRDAKLQLMRLLYERRYSRQEIIDLFRFIDSLIQLPQELEQEFQEEISQYEKEKQMPYVSSIERSGERRGAAAVVSRQLKRRFGELDPQFEQQLSKLSLEQLEALGEAVLDFADRTAFEQWLANHPPSA